ncbi:MAG: hypothetical protein KDA79_02620 [Planctomycetaceae bacterium]|nr:hypothetical protein [Planctomycetaceae bacterium]
MAESSRPAGLWPACRPVVTDPETEPLSVPADRWVCHQSQHRGRQPGPNRPAQQLPARPWNPAEASAASQHASDRAVCHRTAKITATGRG